MRDTRPSGLLVIGIAVIGMACSGSGGSPTTPGAIEPVSSAFLELVDADLIVGGQSINGMTLGPGHAYGEPALFRARLTANHQAAPGHQVWVRFKRPTGMGMMGGSSGQFRLYDDGTHGDPTPGDGIYCFQDAEARYGCNGPNMQNGKYHYEFWGQQHDGSETNHLHVRVRLAQN